MSVSNKFYPMKLVKRIFFTSLTLFQLTNIQAQDYSMPLYSGAIPNSKNTGAVEKVVTEDIKIISNVQTPSIAVYLPSKRFATGQAVLICPGGGYWILAHDLEGTDIARYLNSIGVAAVIKKYHSR